jgi:hypothetical protein
MKTRLVFSGLLTVVFVVGIGVGFLAAPHRPRDTAAPVAENESIQTPAPPALKRARPVYRVSTHGENVASTPDSDPEDAELVTIFVKISFPMFQPSRNGTIREVRLPGRMLEEAEALE